MQISINKASITDGVIDYLMNYIRSDSCLLGQKLPSEASIAQELSVSRPTVREALRVLQAMGYVSIVHGRGAVVRSKKHSSDLAKQWFADNNYSLLDIYVVRRALEIAATTIAAEVITTEEITLLFNNQDQMSALINSSSEQINAYTIAKLDEDFHNIIVESTKNSYLINMYAIINTSLHTYRINSFSILENVRKVIVPHENIIKALEAHNIELAKSSIEYHLKDSEEDLTAAAEKSSNTQY